jgi:drug/metabolite transporter (DMT)-like permease
MLLIWSFNYVAGKIALRQLDPFALASFRLLLAAAVILPFYVAHRDTTVRSPRTPLDLLYLVLLSMAMGVNQFCFTVGLNFTSSGHSSVILATGPVLVLLLAGAMKQEKFTAQKIFGASLAFMGVLLLEAEQGLFKPSPFLKGDLITLCGTSCFALYVVFGKKVARQYDSLSMNTANLVVGAILFLPVAVWEGTHLHWARVGPAAWLGLFYMAAFSSVIAYVLFYWVLRYMSASRVVAVNYLQPVGAIVLSALFVGEAVTRNLIIGAALVVSGVYLAERTT